MKRTPVAPGYRIVAMGVDPGLAKLGVAVIEAGPGLPIRCLAAEGIVTKKATKKELRHMRVTADTARRVALIFGKLRDLWRLYEPRVLGFEPYVPFPGRGASGSKVAEVVGVVEGLGLSFDVGVYPFLPADIKVEFCGKRGATKADLQVAMCSRVGGLAEALDRIPEKLQEHAADAAGHAYLALCQAQQALAMIGIG